MKKFILLPFLGLAVLGIAFFLTRPAAGLLPRPTEIGPFQKESDAFKAERKAFLRQMHRAAPGIDWEAMDQQQRTDKAQARMQRLQQQTAMKKGPNPDFVRDTLANGQVMAHWREIGSDNQSGRIRMAEYDPQTDLLYLASDGGNIWVGDRNGSQWQVRNDLFQIPEIHSMKLVNTGIGKRLVVAHADWGVEPVQYSDDGGFTWQPGTGLGAVVNWGQGLRMVTVPDSIQTIYLLAMEWDVVAWEKTTTVYRSVDQGQSFAPIASFSSNTFGNENEFDLWTDPQTEGPVYLLFQDEVYTLQNGQFIQVGTVPNNPSGRTHLRGKDSTLYVGYRDGSSVNVYRSLNGGTSWTFRGTAPTGLFLRTSFEVSPHDANRLFAGSIDAYTSADGGQSWTKVNNWYEYYGEEATKLHADIPGFPGFTDPNGNPFTIICTDGGAYISYDGLQSVQNISLRGLNVSQYYSTYTSPANPALLFAGSQDQGFQKATQDAGGVVSFEQTISGDYGHLRSGNGGASLWANYPGSTIYFPSPLFNNTLTFEDFPTEGHLWLAPLEVDPLQPNVAYLGGGQVAPGPNGATEAHLIKIQMSGNQMTFTELPQNFSNGVPISAVAISRTFPDHWYVMTAAPRLFFSTNAGQTWSSSNHMNLPENHYFYGHTILPSPSVSGRIYLGGSGYSNPGVYYSLDHGVTIKAMNQGLPNTLVYGLACTPDESMLFAATELGPYLFTASDSTWHAIEGLHAPDQTYWSVEYVPGLHAARFGTYGRGIWDFVICDSLSPLAGEFDFQIKGTENLTVQFSNKSQGAYFYEWIFDDTTRSKQKSPTHNFPGSGTYEVKLLASNHCFVDTLVQQVALIQTDLENTRTDQGLTLFPNPSQGPFFVRNQGESLSGATLRIFTLSGQLVHRQTLSYLASFSQTEIDAKDLSPGLYLVSVTDTNGRLQMSQKLRID